MAPHAADLRNDFLQRKGVPEDMRGRHLFRASVAPGTAPFQSVPVSWSLLYKEDGAAG